MARSGTRFENARFHVETGPAALFDRVRFKLSSCRPLKMHAAHLQARVAERDAPLELLTAFDPQHWQLQMAEVRTDTGKFVNSAWTVQVSGQWWLVVIGFNDTVETVIPTDGRSPGEHVVRDGPLFDRVAQVNAALMAAEEQLNT